MLWADEQEIASPNTSLTSHHGVTAVLPTSPICCVAESATCGTSAMRFFKHTFSMTWHSELPEWLV
jgi:hypothetical protein